MNWLNKVYKPTWSKPIKTTKTAKKPSQVKYTRELRYQIATYLAQFYRSQYQFLEGKLYKRSALDPSKWVFIASLYGEDSYWSHSFEIWYRERKWSEEK